MSNSTQNPWQVLDHLRPIAVQEALLTDLTVYRVAELGITNMDLFFGRSGFTHLSGDPAFVQLFNRLRQKCAEYETQNTAGFQNRICFAAEQPHHLYRHFANSIHAIIADGHLNWRRIVGLFAITAAFCKESVRSGQSRAVAYLVEYATKYIDRNVTDWILMNGGWDAFMHALETVEFRI